MEEPRKDLTTAGLEQVIKLTYEEESKLVDFIGKLPVSRFNWRLIDDEVLRGIIKVNEKAEKLDKYENENWIAVERKVWELERQENKQLKDDLENEKNLNGIVTRQHDNLEQKLEKIKTRFIEIHCDLDAPEDTYRIAKIVKEELIDSRENK